VAFPRPVPGLVIRYSYLWRRERLLGREEGAKDRPCAIVAAVNVEAGGARVLVLPVTHTSPADPDAAVELPAPVKARLGLDEGRSWVVLSEWNEFVWPGPDLRRVPGKDNDSIAYGMLPPRLFMAIRERFLSRVMARIAKGARRS
jgi:hypothetical protein